MCRCLLLGAPPGSAECGATAAAQYIGELLEQAGQPTSQQQAGVLRQLAALLAHHAGSMGAGELRQAAHQLCQAVGLACTQEQQHQLEALLLAGTGPASAAASNAGEQQAAVDADMRSDVPELSTAAGKPKKPGKSVKFADACSSEDAQHQQQEEEEGHSSEAAAPAAAQPTAVASSSRASRGRRAAATRSRRGAAAPVAAAADSEQAVVSSSCPPGEDSSPVATLSAVGSTAEAVHEEAPQTAARGAGLCQVFDSLSLDDPTAPGTATASAAPATGTIRAGGTTTTRTGKHRSRLRMLQAGTPGPATARKSLAAAAAAGAGAGAASAPRPARELPLTVAKTAPPLASRPSSREGLEAAAAAASPVLLVLDGALQALPWESAPGLLRQR